MNEVRHVNEGNAFAVVLHETSNVEELFFVVKNVLANMHDAHAEQGDVPHKGSVSG